MDRKNERVSKEVRGKISNLVKKRKKRKETRVSTTDVEIVDKLIHSRSLIQLEDKLALKERKELRSRDSSFFHVLSEGEQRISYERWEALSLRTKCIENEHGYRVKANQKGRAEWSKKRITGFESDLRNYEKEVPEYQDILIEKKDLGKSNEGKSDGSLTRLTSLRKTRDEKDEFTEKNQVNEWDFWKYYLEKDAQQARLWKKGGLYKKKMRKNQITSWDRVTYVKEPYEKRRTRSMRRRYVRSGGYVLPNRNDEVSIEKEAFLENKFHIPELRRKKQRSKKQIKSLLRGRWRTYYKLENVEDRKRSMGLSKRKHETGFQGLMRKQTSTQIQIGKLTDKPLNKYKHKSLRFWSYERGGIRYKTKIRKRKGLVREQVKLV